MKLSSQHPQRLISRFLPFEFTFPILRGPLRGTKWISSAYPYWRAHGPGGETQRMMREVRRAGVFYDIGAKAGFYSLLASSLCDPGQVYAFEPDAAHRELLKRHLAMNHVTNVEVIPLALAGDSGAAADEAGQCESCLSGAQAVPAQQNRAEAATMDVLLRAETLTPPHCLRIDMEGLELRVLRGARECLAKYRPTIFLTAHDAESYKACRALLNVSRYECEEMNSESPQRFLLFAFPRGEARNGRLR